MGKTIDAALVLCCTLLAVQQNALAGQVIVSGKYPRQVLKEGAAKKNFYVIEKNGVFRLKAEGPVNLVLLVRSPQPAKTDLRFQLDKEKQATKSLSTKAQASTGILLIIEKGKHELEVTVAEKAMVFPVMVKRSQPAAGEELLLFEPVEKPTTAAEVPPTQPPAALSEPPSPLPPVSEVAEERPSVPAEWVPSPPAPAVASAAEAASGAPPAISTEEAKGIPSPQIEMPNAATEQEQLVSEERKEPEPRLDPAGIGYFGQRSIYRTWSAIPYSKHSVAVGSSIEYSKSSSFLADGDENQRLLGRLVAAGVPFPGFEINAGFSIMSNRNTAFDPRESQSIGDPFLGVRYGYRLLDWFAASLGVQALVPSGQRFSQLSTEGISTRILFAFDFIPLPEALVSLNVGYHFDNSKRIFDYPLTEAQLFAAGINPHDQVLVTLGLAWQFGPVAPFLEYGMAQAVGSDVDIGFADNPGWLTLGARAWPLGFHTFHVLAAVDIGLTGVHPPDGAGRIPPWNVILSLGYDFGAAPPPAVVEKHFVRTERVETAAQAGAKVILGGGGSRVVGKVLDAGTGKPIGGARVVMGGDEPAIFLSDPEEGRFYTCPMVPGPVKLSVFREGYREESQMVLVTEKPETPVTIKLQTTAAAAFGTIKGTVRSVTGLPLPALVAIPARDINIRAQRFDGSFERKLETGSFDVLFSMPGYVTQRRRVKLEAGDVVILNVELYPKK